MRRIVDFIASLRGRIFLLLTCGMTVSAAAAMLVAQDAQRHIVNRLRLADVVMSTADIAGRLERDPQHVQTMLADDRIIGARLPPPSVDIKPPDPQLTEMLRARLGPQAAPSGQELPGTACFPARQFEFRQRLAGLIKWRVPDCWLVRFKDAAGSTHAIAIGMPASDPQSTASLGTIYLALTLFASALLAIVTAHFATSPLRRLTRAAQAFSLSPGLAPIPEEGPEEVRTTIATFNLMQQRVTDGFRERTHILAAISHDLQTPLTRLRLRLEQVSDEALRARLIADVASMHRLVREGLDLAHSSEDREEWQIVDIDSLLASLAEDAAEFGSDARFMSGCGESIRTKPDALIRCLTNLIDNSIKHGGDAELSCVRTGAALEIAIRDHGDGISTDKLEQMFEPFVRGETSRSRATGGTGIGLTIARATAKLFGGEVKLSNHAEGGLVATVRIGVQN